MKITAIRKQKGSREKVNVYFGETRITLATEVALDARLHVGDELDEGELDALRARQGAWRCREMALNLLSYRPRSRRELRDRLLRRDAPADVVEACLDELARARLIDDDAFGVTMALDRLRSRPVGRSRLIAELRRRGLDADGAERAVRRAWEEAGIPEIELARTAARKFRRRPGEDARRAKRRLYAFLGRRGFGGEAVAGIAEELFGVE